MIVENERFSLILRIEVPEARADQQREKTPNGW